MEKKKKKPKVNQVETKSPWSPQSVESGNCHSLLNIPGLPHVKDTVTQAHATPPQFRPCRCIHPCRQEQQESALRSLTALTSICSKDKKALTTPVRGTDPYPGLLRVCGCQNSFISIWSHLHNMPKGRHKHLFCNKFSKDNNKTFN